ncbi:Mg-dependent DNase [Coprinopsis marcescibilis]|uniref:Mg-dependent DNase n=1 Tax=Coprinopsis marcescibilis TaxID=230819 RepID=A0A5C3LCL1_COPMA|nr:Mg-dependent DNase [Coprinopsis marcescibilis]
MTQWSRASIMASITQSLVRGSTFKFIDIAVNLTDPVYRGVYHGKRKHDDDLEDVLHRARSAGVSSMIITGTSLKESKEALELAKSLGHSYYATVGCHPTRSGEFETYQGGPDAYLTELDNLIAAHLQGEGRVVAVGECGLDYDRTHFAAPDVQKKYFKVQLSLAKRYNLPLFLHSRAAHNDFVEILRESGFAVNGGRDVGGKGGVVHSFTGTPQEAAELISMGFHVGINGCSLKTDESLLTAKSIPLDRLLLETDAPWCTMASTHASKGLLDTLPDALRDSFLPQATKAERFVKGKSVKGRNEPTSIGAVAWVMHRLLQVPYPTLVNSVWNNTVALFSLFEIDSETPDPILLNAEDSPPI